jgi:hypothetical protein
MNCFERLFATCPALQTTRIRLPSTLSRGRVPPRYRCLGRLAIVLFPAACPTPNRQVPSWQALAIVLFPAACPPPNRLVLLGKLLSCQFCNDSIWKLNKSRPPSGRNYQVRRTQKPSSIWYKYSQETEPENRWNCTHNWSTVLCVCTTSMILWRAEGFAFFFNFFFHPPSVLQRMQPNHAFSILGAKTRTVRSQIFACSEVRSPVL